ncbi:SIS domain-containing protein [Candidatus Enterococcus courvalinii]|uniref:MurR/RpiR family transcriptional regulator n=1 Tax=Candidatus Enterococcus courvalinii TaxID=2815329 RepID=A0ABS3HWB9_9ENTE|nr:MurR/RpiR family transcriptional regulator [Enterococcus sp. MSG2901]
MFESEKIKQLNELEMIVYNYLIANLEEVSKMTIRQLSDACHVSTSTILRCCNKLGLQGFSELKFAIKNYQTQAKQQMFEQFYDATVQVDSFLKKVNNESYRIVLEQAVQMIVAARHVAFSGIGTSGVLGLYGSRYFINLGLNAYSITDPFAPVPSRGLESTLAIILSVSGETSEMIEKTEAFKRYGAKVLSITNDETSTIARLADYNLSYYMPETRGKEESLNLTTQVPVVTLLEMLAQKASQEMERAH